MTENINLLYLDYLPEQARLLVDQLASMLNTTDFNRFSSISSINRKTQFLFGRLLAAQSASNVLGFVVLPSSLQLKVSGCPYFPDYPELAVNISHSRQRVAACCAKLKNLGMDIEWQNNTSRPFLEMAKRSFSSQEYLHLASLSKDELPSAFYKKWTHYEAQIKANVDPLTLKYIKIWQADNYQHCVLSSECFVLIKQRVSLAGVKNIYPIF